MEWKYSFKNQVLSTLLSCASSWVTELFQDLWDPLLPTSLAEEKDSFGITPSLLEEHIAELTNGHFKVFGGLVGVLFWGVNDCSSLNCFQWGNARRVCKPSGGCLHPASSIARALDMTCKN